MTIYYIFCNDYKLLLIYPMLSGHKKAADNIHCSFCYMTSYPWSSTASFMSAVDTLELSYVTSAVPASRLTLTLSTPSKLVNAPLTADSQCPQVIPLMFSVVCSMCSHPLPIKITLPGVLPGHFIRSSIINDDVVSSGLKIVYSLLPIQN